VVGIFWPTAESRRPTTAFSQQAVIRLFLPKPKSGKVKQAMVEELEQEYAALKDKVRDLREYL
jgi:hypothetical protein